MGLHHAALPVAVAGLLACAPAVPEPRPSPSAGATAEPLPPHDPRLPMTVTCRDGCAYTGRDLFISVAFTNRRDVPIGFPLAFVQKTGPSIRLQGTYLRTNPADFALERQFKVLAPGEAATLEWVLHPSELEAAGSPAAEVVAALRVVTTIQVGGADVPFDGGTTLRIPAGRAP